MTTTLVITPANRAQYEKAQQFWQQVLQEALQRGFFGTVLVELKVNDGTIQHVRRQVEQVEKGGGAQESKRKDQESGIKGQEESRIGSTP